jgi:WD40 repeat protein
VEFSAEGRTLATASADGTVRLWDVGTRQPIGSPLTVESDTFVSAALSPDSSYVFAVSTGLRGVRLAIDPTVWKHQACVIAGREMSRQEWRDELPDRPYQAVCSDG